MKRLTAFLSAFCFGLACHAQVNIITYNIRYDNTGDGENAWLYRREALTDSLKMIGPGLLCLQEVLNNQYRYLQVSLKEYGSYGVGRDDGINNGEYAPVFYRKDLFHILDSGTFWLAQKSDEPGKGWDAALNRIVTLVKLEVKSNKKILFVFNTHFDHKGITARLESARLIIAKSKQIAATHACIVTGDFNFTPLEEPYALISFAGFEDAFEANKSSNSFTFTGFKLNLGIAKRIDYIFYNSFFKVSSYQTPWWQTIAGNFLSDHLPVHAKLEWIK